MKINLKDEIIRLIGEIDVTDDFYRQVYKLIVDWHVVNSISFGEDRLRKLYESLDLNDDVEYDKHVVRQEEIRDRVLRCTDDGNEEIEDEEKSAAEKVVEARKSPDFIQKLQTHDGIGDAVISIQNGVEIKREYPWGIDKEDETVDFNDEEIYNKHADEQQKIKEELLEKCQNPNWTCKDEYGVNRELPKLREKSEKKPISARLYTYDDKGEVFITIENDKEVKREYSDDIELYKEGEA